MTMESYEISCLLLEEQMRREQDFHHYNQNVIDIAESEDIQGHLPDLL